VGDRDAKGLSLELKRMLSASNPWDREVEFQRESCVTPTPLLPSPELTHAGQSEESLPPDPLHSLRPLHEHQAD
jgi:hypothetical protein